MIKFVHAHVKIRFWRQKSPVANKIHKAIWKMAAFLQESWSSIF